MGEPIASEPRAPRVFAGRGGGALRPGDWLWLAVLAVVYAPAFVSMARIWRSVDYYSHGFMVPVLAAGFFVSKLPSGDPALDRRGEWCMAAALVAYAAGLATQVVALQGFAFVAALAGWVLRRWGPAGLRQLSFPLGFLCFMVPLPLPWIAPVIVKLQAWVAVVSTALLNAGGMAVVREGNVIVLPSGQSMFMAEACSGITSIVTLLPLGVVVAYFQGGALARRLLTVAAVIPIAMAGNLLRVVGTALVAEAWGTDIAVADGLHEAAGILTFTLACLAVVAVGLGLRGSDAPA